MRFPASSRRRRLLSAILVTVALCISIPLSAAPAFANTAVVCGQSYGCDNLFPYWNRSIQSNIGLPASGPYSCGYGAYAVGHWIGTNEDPNTMIWWSPSCQSNYAVVSVSTSGPPLNDIFLIRGYPVDKWCPYGLGCPMQNRGLYGFQASPSGQYGVLTCPNFNYCEATQIFPYQNFYMDPDQIGAGTYSLTTNMLYAPDASVAVCYRFAYPPPDYYGPLNCSMWH